MNDQGEFSVPGGWATYFIIFQFLLLVLVILLYVISVSSYQNTVS